METNESLSSATEAPRDPATISPSAYSLLLMKARTSIPYAREAAALLQKKSAPTEPALPSVPADAPVFDTAAYWASVLHFESRYWSINQLLADLTATNILEISSGFSFRGLALSNTLPVYYIDTDLPNIIAGKQGFVDALTGISAPAGPTTNGPATPGPAETNQPPAGHYELCPLNALDPAAFEAVVARFPPGPLTIVNEGLLVYLDDAEKKQLCANIRNALLARGGHWITADIYVRKGERTEAANQTADVNTAGQTANPHNAPPTGDAQPNGATSAQHPLWRKWSEEHKLEEKKFTSFHDAEAFFNAAGFKLDKEAEPDYSRLTSLSQYLKAAGSQAGSRQGAAKVRQHATWLLTPIR
jgi:hypothetical protein